MRFNEITYHTKAIGSISSNTRDYDNIEQLVKSMTVPSQGVIYVGAEGFNEDNFHETMRDLTIESTANPAQKTPCYMTLTKALIGRNEDNTHHPQLIVINPLNNQVVDLIDGTNAQSLLNTTFHNSDILQARSKYLTPETHDAVAKLLIGMVQNHSPSMYDAVITLGESFPEAKYGNILQAIARQATAITQVQSEQDIEENRLNFDRKKQALETNFGVNDIYFNTQGFLALNLQSGDHVMFQIADKFVPQDKTTPFFAMPDGTWSGRTYGALDSDLRGSYPLGALGKQFLEEIGLKNS